MRMKTKIKPPKMTELDKKEQHRGSRFVKIIPSHAYARWRTSKSAEHVFDEQGYRTH